MTRRAVLKALREAVEVSGTSGQGTVIMLTEPIPVDKLLRGVKRMERRVKEVKR